MNGRKTAFAALLSGLLVLSIHAALLAQPPALEFGNQFGQPSFGSAGKELKLSGTYKVVKGKSNGQLSIKAKAAPGWHTYSLTQKGGPGPSKLTVESSDQFEVTGRFEADHDPHTRLVTLPDGKPVWDEPVEEFEDVTWTAPIKLAEGVDAESLDIKVKFDGQVCSDEGGCIPIFGEIVPVKFAGYIEPPSGEYRSPFAAATIRGHVEPKVAAPGDTVKLKIEAIPDKDYHVYEYAQRDPNKGNKPTLFVLTKTNDWKSSKPVASAPPVADKSGDKDAKPYHEDPVTWTIELQVPIDTEPQDYMIAGLIGYQTCDVKGLCKPPTAAQFSATIPVQSKSIQGTAPLSFERASYDTAAELAEQSLARSTAGGGSSKLGGSANSAAIAVIIGQLGLAFLAGLILNVMPCVLPVIGLKLMSFVNQAGESRVRALVLNIWYSVGIWSVFLVIATVAVAVKVFADAAAGGSLTTGTGDATLSWGAWLGKPAISIPLLALVFVLGLSLLGVWEIPVPGFAGSSKANELAAKEGPVGAVFKGALTTILATPCTGPFVIGAVGFAVTAPPWLTYTTFTVMALGMASPYLLVGAAPKLISWLPKPGPWMETFKQLMGFVLMATVVWIAYFLQSASPEFVVPMLILLVALGFACWLIGRTPMTAELGQQLKAWAAAGVLVTLVSVALFVKGTYIIPGVSMLSGALIAGLLIGRTSLNANIAHKVLAWGGAAGVLLVAVAIMYLSLMSAELPWRPFTRATLDQHLDKGQTVLVDFTADW